MATGVLERRATPGPSHRADRLAVARLRLVAGTSSDGARSEIGAEPAPAPVRAKPAVAVVAARRDAVALVALVVGFCVFGLVMVLSSSSVASIANYGSPWSIFEHQGAWMAIGAVAFVVAARLDLQFWRRVAVPCFLGTLVLLVAVLVRGIGTVAAGSSRWIALGPLRIQPSEFAKFAVVLFVADLLARRLGTVGPRADVVRPVLIALAVLGVLIVRQPDLGTTVVIAVIGAVLLYAAGAPLRKIAAVAGVFVVLAGAFFLIEPYGRARLFAFWDPFAHASTTGYQVVQSLLTLGSGHVFGTGLGGSPAAWGFLPNANSDFIFAIIGNNFGLVGAISVLGGFLAIGWLGLRIARRSEDRFASLVAIGVTAWIVFQALINIAGVVGVLPDTGIPLPFLSSGGSSLVVLLAATGLLVRIASHPEAKTRSFAVVQRERRRARMGR
ncbi:MAG TPA: putative lipid II flippase FtsW [Acidimicrobiales bacterium]|nr:putative lipid II flippase FtsW [Acidimicrobiales bacterium]